jgi:hypothetical protein
MSLTKAFRQKVRAVRIRYGINLFLRHAGRVLAVCGGVIALAVLVQRLLAVPVLVSWVLWVFWGVVAAIVLVLWLLGLPSRMKASLLLDERLRLHERFSTTLSLAASDDPFAQAARAESLRTIEQADLRGHFPISLSRSWYYCAAIWVVVAILAQFVPEKDLLGFLKKKQQQNQQAQEVAQAQAEVQKSTDAVKAVVGGLQDPAMEKDLKKLDELAQAGEPQELKREAIKTLGDLSEKIKQMQGGQVDAGNILQQMLRQLRGSADPFSQQIRMALAKGDFAQAAALMRQLQNQLATGTLSDQQRKDMAEQLQKLAQEMKSLAAQKRQLEDELEKRGLDKKLAELSEQQLRQALQKQGLKPEAIDQLMEKMAACQSASGKCSALAMAMAASGEGSAGLSADELAGAIDHLDALETMQQELSQLQAGLDEISRCMGQLGEGMCDGIGGQSPWAAGQANRYGSGSGGPGQGYGPRDSDTEGQTGTKTTRVAGQSDQGPVIAGWYFKDTQVKGEARRDFTQVIEAGRASAAEAISENQIPRRYEDAVKEYFGQLERRGPKP